MDSLVYATRNTTNTQTYKGTFVSQFWMQFDDISGLRAIVKVIVLDGRDYLTFDVFLNSIPVVKQNQYFFIDELVNEIFSRFGQGMEVTANWNTPQIQNNQTWYTDSNGMAMIKRVFNYRRYWEFETGNDVSANYYPVN